MCHWTETWPGSSSRKPTDTMETTEWIARNRCRCTSGVPTHSLGRDQAMMVCVRKLQQPNNTGRQHEPRARNSALARSVA
jgi:hypothetical protein